MQQGAANDRQTKLNFIPKKSQNDTTRNPTQHSGSNNADNDNEGNRPKRTRTAFEDANANADINRADNNTRADINRTANLQVPGTGATNSGSDTSLFNADSVGTIVDRSDLSDRDVLSDVPTDDIMGPREDRNNLT